MLTAFTQTVLSTKRANLTTQELTSAMGCTAL
jgi:hypothetical protein